MGSWSVQPPTESGSYWWRQDEDDDYEIFNVFVGTGAACVWVSKNASVGFEDIGGEWWSDPIPVPPRQRASEAGR